MPDNKALIFNSIPDGLPVAGRDLVIHDVSYPACPKNGVLVQSMYASIDPYQRGRMRHSNVESYAPPFVLGAAINGRGIAKVLESTSAKFKKGDIVIGMLPVQQYVCYDENRLGLLEILDNPLDIEDLRVFLGALGIPGVTAYAGLHEIGKPTKGDTIFVSAASGAVGQMVGQLAKLEGLRVIGSVGSDEKLEFITGILGFDAGFNYQRESPKDALARLAPQGLDIYWDNVGGEQLDATMGCMKDFGRIVVCGTISEYNTAQEHHYPLRSYSYIFSKRLTVRGFVCSDKGIMDKYGREHQDRVQRLIKDGTITTQTWEVKGIENSTEAFLALFSGKNLGKVVLKY